MKHKRSIPHIHYTGDMDITCGGTFYNLAAFRKWGYAQAVRVTPCSDAGLADNEFWVETLTVNRQSEQREREAIDSLGWIDNEAEMGPKNRAQYWHLLFEALLSYGHYDRDECKAVRVGKPQKGREPNQGERLADSVITDQLRGNACIRRFAFKVARDYIA